MLQLWLSINSKSSHMTYLRKSLWKCLKSQKVAPILAQTEIGSDPLPE